MIRLDFGFDFKECNPKNEDVIERLKSKPLLGSENSLDNRSWGLMLSCLFEKDTTDGYSFWNRT